MPWRTPMPDHQWAAGHEIPEQHRIDPAPPGLRGEFDDLIDVRYPTLSTANVGEAFPGTLTPMSLFVGRDALRVAGAIQVEMLGMRDESVVAAQRRLAIASVGHRLYTNVSVVHAMARAMPGTSPREVDEHVLGIPHDPADEMEAQRARVFDTVSTVLGLPSVVARMAGTGRRVAALRQRIGTLSHPPAALTEFPDNALLTMTDALRESTIDAWAYSTTTNLAASAAQTLVRKLAPELDAAAMRGGTTGLMSAGLLGGVAQLAEMVRSRPRLAGVLDSSPPAELIGDLVRLDAVFAQRFWTLVAESGHRGPGETELANLMYADNPAALLDAVRTAVHAPARPVTPLPDLWGLPRRAVRLLTAAVRRRERSKDVAVRSTHALRTTLREIGRRQVESGVLAEVGDVFYLTPSEIADPPRHAGRIAGRRAERDRLSAMSLPTLFTLRWDPQTPSAAGKCSVLTGVGASPGVIRGPARMMRSPDDDLAPGDVLVTSVTDVGWTALFGGAAAVVTDVGGLHSHAAIIAREFGIPCVVGTERASLDLLDGQLIEVDGARGTVTPLS